MSLWCRKGRKMDTLSLKYLFSFWFDSYSAVSCQNRSWFILGAWCKNSVWLVWCNNLFSFILRGLMQELILIYFEPELILILIHFERFDARIDCLWFDGITSVAGTSGHNIGWGYWIILNEQTNKHTLGDVGRWIILNQQTNKYWSRFLNNLQYQPIGRSHETLSNNRQ